MTKVFNPGDKVRLVRGEEVLSGEVIHHPDMCVIRALNLTRWESDWRADGFEVSVVPSTPTLEAELPREPGAYADNQGRPWILARNQQWIDWSGTYVGRASKKIFECAPFDHLGSRESWRASWAAEIADAVESKANSPILSTALAASFIRSEFGGAVVDE